MDLPDTRGPYISVLVLRKSMSFRVLFGGAYPKPCTPSNPFLIPMHSTASGRCTFSEQPSCCYGSGFRASGFKVDEILHRPRVPKLRTEIAKLYISQGDAGFHPSTAEPKEGPSKGSWGTHMVSV